MRISAYVITAALAAGLPGAAMAQSQPQPPAAVPVAASAPIAGPVQSHWLLTGFVGSNFSGNTVVDPSPSFGGQIAYLWRGVFGGEAIADFAPGFNINNVFLAENPRMNAYMGNAIFAMPIGHEGQWQPYVSGGAGTVSLRAVVFNAFLPGVGGLGTTTSEQSKFGWDVGGGLMGFKGLIGFRADVRYFKTDTNLNLSNQTTSVGVFEDTLLTGLSFWRANIGIALRW
jgi:hypothetical protein